MRKYLFPALLMLVMISCLRGYSQQTDKEVPVKRDYFLRFNFLGLMDPFDNNLSVGAELPLSPHFAITLDAGWIFHSQFFINTKSTNGIILRPAFRWYPRAEGRGFIDVELHHKMVSYRIEDWIGRDCDNEVPAYDEFTTFTYRKNSYGVNLRGGVKSALDREKKFWLEFSGGLGIRWRNQGIHKEPNSCYNRVGTFFNPNGPNVVTGMPMTIRGLFKL